MNATTREQIGAKLREARTRRGWSLQRACDESADRFPAVVIGSYERGNRAVTAERLVDLAALYGVPAASLLPGGQVDDQVRALVVDDIADGLHRKAARLREGTKEGGA